jgi:5-methylcytosine-specific restriction endonuclease McrA
MAGRGRYHASQRRRVIELHGTTCFYCGIQTREDVSPSSPIRTTMDHLLPKKEGGLTRMKNLRIACRKCNTMRGSKDLLTFMASMGMCTDLRKNFDLAHTLYEVAAIHGLLET